MLARAASIAVALLAAMLADIATAAAQKQGGTLRIYHRDNPPSASLHEESTVSVTQPAQTQATQVGIIQLALFPNPGGLNSVGNNLMLATTASGDPIVGTPGGTEGLGSLQQGFLEQSNVDVVQEFVEMILSQRSYESNSRVVKAADEMFQDLNSLTR